MLIDLTISGNNSEVEELRSTNSDERRRFVNAFLCAGGIFQGCNGCYMKIKDTQLFTCPYNANYEVDCPVFFYVTANLIA